MSEVKISVCVNDEFLNDIEQVTHNLETAGMNVEQTLSSIGIISGSVESEQLNQICQIKGVKNVENEQDYYLSDPSSDIQ